MNQRVIPGAGVSTDRLASLIALQQRLLDAEDLAQAEYVLVNDSAYPFPARQLILFRHGTLRAHSGAAEVDAQSPYLQWVRRVARAFQWDQDGDAGPAREVDKAALAERSPELAEQWNEYWPARGLWVPINAGGRARGGLLLLRERAWSEAEGRLLGHWLATAEPVLARLSRRPPLTSKRKLAVAAAVLVTLALVSIIPVPLSMLGNAEIVPEASSIVRAPIEGVVARLAVSANQSVEQGQLLVEMDDARIRGRLAAAEQALAVARARYQRARQSAFSDPKASAELPVLSAQVDQAAEDVAFYSGELERVRVTAPRAGVALVQNPDDWAGRPVQLGEKLMEVADTHGSEVELWLPAADVIPLADGAEVSLFLNVDPAAVRHATLTQVNYRAEQAPNGVLAYRAHARLAEGEALPRVGWRGTARVEGEQVTLAYYLLRRPWATVRSWLGW
ncbi:efflux RND transporter periplasmic adaptor subunit [Alloalcanivorax gelatiniphagus]|uniref:HlyD family efflux transporter periplasmic adaptor subunit n=1 Tax=Alloalcanivorax gelatiniphagus TaxID=1194167 RepID=A0ABY2XQ37_9GAMM|nr:HlyD family efflux transporter periplasmic adaptor subunit [Alloalcanivorax gelatiniphagus]TMW13760.1 HlyD family efflux transporter periplasmic adaptor subunit [Alloalcanivorax gelatiniphagus]